MPSTCVACGKAIEAADYRLVGVEQGSWESRYAHRGACEAEARARFAPARTRPKRAARAAPSPSEPVVEELTLDAPDPFPAQEELPWFGLERRR